MELLKFEDVSVGYEGKPVAEHLNFTVSEGDYLCIVGENGAGKSTLMKTLLSLKTPLSEEKIRTQLGKTGGTAYCFEQLTVDIGDNLSLPISALNSLRRSALEKTDRSRALVHNYKINREKIDFDFAPYHAEKQTVRARVTGTKLSPAFRGCELVFVPLFADTREIDRLLREGYPVGVEIPRGMFGREKQIHRQLERVREIGVSHALCHNIGALYAAKSRGFVLHGGFGLNLVNTYDLLWAHEYGLADVELSFELTLKQINRLGGDSERGGGRQDVRTGAPRRVH